MRPVQGSGLRVGLDLVEADVGIRVWAGDGICYGWSLTRGCSLTLV